MRHVSPFAIVLVILSVFSFPTFLSQIVPPANATSASFSFAASGDMGSLTATTSISNLNRLVTASPNFFLGLGDFSYDPSVTGNTWCGQFKSSFNGIQILPGDHDTGGHNSASFGETHSYVRYVNGCPLTLGVPLVCGSVAGNCYGKEYYFDYPATNPVARFIFTSPKIYNITGVCTSSPNCSSQTGQPCTDQYGCWPYASGDIHYNWVSNAIDGARATGIKWVIVATHKLCISSSDATCSMGLGFFNMLVQKKVDLIIQAHDNAYERSKQIALNPATCASIKTDGNGYALYNSGCVVDTGSRGFYTPGAGSVVVAQGAWVNDLYGVNASSSNPENVAEAPYFVKLMGSNTPGKGLGFTKYTVSASRIDVQTNFSGTYSDSFSIWGGPSPVPSASWSPLSPQVGQTVTFTGTASGGVAPYSFTWDFGDAGKAAGTMVSHAYTSANYFNVTLTTIDSANNTGSSRSIIAVGSWNPSVPCVPSLTALSSILGTAYPSQSLAGSRWQTNSTSGGIPNKRALAPPCAFTNINGQSVSSYVEVDNVYLTSSSYKYETADCTTHYDPVNGGGSYNGTAICDSTGNVFSVGTTSGFLHIEFDHDWMAKGYCGPGRSPCDNSTITQYFSAGSISLNIQGFVYWDLEAPAHWEIHPITGWRLGQTGVPTVTVNNPTPNPAGTGAAVSLAFAVSSSTSITGVSVNWGDGSTPDSLPGTATSDTHIYSSTGSSKTQTFTIIVTATNSAGNGSGSTTETVNDRPPVVTVSGVAPNPATTGATVSVNFSATDPDGTISSISLSWGDNSTLDSLPGTATSDTHSYSSAGSFMITVAAADSSGSTGSATTSETVDDRPPAVTVGSVSPNPALAGQTVTVTFSATDPDGTISSFSVGWGDGSAADSLPGTATSDTHTYSSGGSFTITVTATDSSGSLGSGTISETVSSPGPIVNATSVTPNPAETGATVTIGFTVSSTLPVSSITVDWGDGTTPDNLPTTATSDTHIYASTGSAKSQTFTITVSATSSAGTGSASKQETVNDRNPVLTIASVTPNPASTGVTITVSFNSTDADGIVSGITVNWGDGTAIDNMQGTATSATHTYASTGTVTSKSFTITVTATDNSGSTGAAFTSETVNDRPPAVTVTNVSPNPANTGQLVTVTFTASDVDGTPSSVTINWGDGSVPSSLPGSATSATHTYTSTGTSKSQTFTLTLTVTDNSGSTGQQTSSVTINDRAPAVTISRISPNPANTGQLVTLTFTATDPDGTISSVRVSWGDGTIPDSLPGTAASDTHSYTQVGAFTINITETDNSGSIGQAMGTVTITVPTASPYALVVTAEGKVYKLYPNGTLTLVGQPVTTPLRQVAWKPDGSYALIAGDFAVLLKYDGTQLTTVPTGISTGYNFWSVSWKQDGTYALIGGSVGLLLKYDGVSMTQITNTGGTTILSMSWYPSGSYVVLAGKSGVLRTYDGTTIRSFATGTTNDLNAVAWNPNGQYALIGALNGVVLTFNGTTVSPVNTNGLTGTNAIKAIAFNPPGSLALLVGDNGMVLTYNGSTLTLLPTITSSWLYAVSWSPSGTAYILGGSGTILTYTNGTLAKLTSNPVTTSQFRGIAWKPN